eukprot:gnl/TRDRNA2_/TRDRNA2_169645_c2_seq1.p1 gnl/TRDRNA2_/TRDRNA2_169645_c2~~gnl/TRDRNA2_/TRDRNA2_169645_c2_seq1.p1  ORF type:complete len:387 (+),score=73.59 gnl/TRDRNA2_/TRDRNA2_169645_c2_seq1:2-1162(+)
MNDKIRALQGEMLAIRANSQGTPAAHAKHDGRTSYARSRPAMLDKWMQVLKIGHDQWEKNFTKQLQAMSREMCSDMRRQNYSSCAQFRKANLSSEEPKAESTAAPSRPTLRGSAIARLSWQSVLSWQDAEQDLVLRIAEQVGDETEDKDHMRPTVTRSELERAAAFWDGELPKVACVTVIPSTPAAKAYLKYFLPSFITNWQKQTYAGATQLVFVYEHTNSDARTMLQVHADGKSILAAATASSSLPGEVFPSSSSFRYGMWMAHDADVIARWDFGTWHDPRRLELQVRALAMAARPASLLGTWMEIEGGDEDPSKANRIVKTGNGTDWDTSLLGEITWMRRHWHPMRNESQRHEELDVREARHVVHIADMPQLMVHNPGLGLRMR